MKADVVYRFSLCNFSKPDSLYNYGMKPVLYSTIEAEKHYVGWSRVGNNIRYVILIWFEIVKFFGNLLGDLMMVYHSIYIIDTTGTRQHVTMMMIRQITRLHSR